MEQIDQATVNKVKLDLIKYSHKINAMMEITTEGPAPQLCKLYLFKEMGDFAIKDAKKRYSRKEMKITKKFIDNFISTTRGFKSKPASLLGKN